MSMGCSHGVRRDRRSLARSATCQASTTKLLSLDHGTVRPRPATFQAKTTGLSDQDQRPTKHGSATFQAKTTGLHRYEGHSSKRGRSLGITMTSSHPNDEVSSPS